MDHEMKQVTTSAAQFPGGDAEKGVCSHEACWLVAVSSLGLQLDLQTKLFGQHIASRIILKAVTGFMSNDNPKKPLVLSLHGPSGTGKSFVSQLIADNIYKEGMDSSFVHVFTSELHFPHSSHLDTYKVRWWIQLLVTVTALLVFVLFIWTCCLSSVSATAVDQRQRHQLWTLHVHLWWDGQDATWLDWQHKTVPWLPGKSGWSFLSESHLHLPQVRIWKYSRQTF